MVFLSLMLIIKTRHCWRSDLSDFRGLTEGERSVFPLVLEWFETYRARCGLEAGRDAIEAFWREEVVPVDRPRESWQLEQWKNAIQWYLNWLDACAVDHTEYRTLPEWALAAAQAAGTRRGLSPITIGCYKAWAKRYAAFAGSEREMRRLETANRFLAAVVDDAQSAYPTQKQALNALTFFFKHVCGSGDAVFDVKLKKPNRA
jgi:Phage integrase, N-terminal SAM-like domain